MPDTVLQQATPLAFRAALAPASWSEAAGTVDIVWSTGAAVPRRDWRSGQDYIEILSMAPGAVDLSRLNAGANALDTHASYSLDGIVGAVVPGSAKITGGEGRATIRLSENPAKAGIRADIAAGVIRFVSVGYVVSEWTVTTATTEQPETRTAVRWTPYEISFVPIPADPGAQVRAGNPKGTTMPHDVATIIPDATAAERSRASDLLAIARTAGMPDGWAADHIAAGTTTEAARAVALAHQARTATPRVPAQAAGLDHDGDQRPELRAMQDALVSRMAGTDPRPEARQYRGMSLIEMARSAMELTEGPGARRMSPAQVVTRMHTTGDFPNLLQGAGTRFLMDRYAAAQSPVRTALARARDVPDFRAVTLLRLSEAPLLDEVHESGEVTRGSATESAEGYTVKTLAKIFAMTRQAWINDDLNAFGDFLTNMAAAAAESEARALIALFTANAGLGADLADGNELFHVSRGNTGSGVLGVSTVATARATMRKTTGMDAVTPIAAEPRYLLVSPDNETAADQVVTAITPHASTDVNPFAGTLMKLCEPRLTGVPWYLFADPARAPVIECAYLEGSNRGPILETKDGWDVLGVEFRAVLDFGCGVIGWRGAFRSTGA